MSNVMSLPSPMRRASACAPTTPAAGPDSMMWMGVAAAAASVMRPPLDCMIRSGVFTPDVVEAGPQRGQVAAHDRHHIGVDHGRRGALVLPDFRQHLDAVAGHELGRVPADDRLDLLLVNGVGVRVDQADGEGLTPSRRSRARACSTSPRSSGVWTAPCASMRSVTSSTQGALDERRRLLPREVVQARHAEAADLEDVAEPPGGDEPRASALLLEDGVGGHGGSVEHLGEVRTRDPRVAEDLAEPIDDRPRVVVDAGGDLLGVRRPLASRSTMSVNVPPMSTPTLNKVVCPRVILPPVPERSQGESAGHGRRNLARRPSGMIRAGHPRALH